MKKTIVLATAFAVAVPALAIGSATISPGLYKVTTISSLQSQPIVETECVTSSKAASGYFELDVAKSCRILRQVRANGKVDLAAACADGAATSVSGTYTPTGYTTVTRAKTRIGAMTVRSVARRVAATCTVEE